MNTTAKQPRVAFIGLGSMGLGMAHRVIAAGFPLTVYNRNPEKASPLVAAGAERAATPREVVEHADFVICMVSDDAASREVWLGRGGAMGSVAREAVIIESSTLSVGWVRELSDAATVLGCEMIDAPVTGSKIHAASGELNFLVGGSVTALEKARPVLSVMSRSIVHVGPTGSGAMLKLINNFMSIVQAVSLAEAVTLVERSGLDRAKAIEVLTNGAPGSPLVKTLSARMTARDFTPNFLLQLAAKDLRYAIEEGRSSSVTLATAVAALEVCGEAIKSGHGGEDFSSVVEHIRRSTAG